MPLDLSTILSDGEYLRRSGDDLTGDTGSRFVPVVIFNGESNSGGAVPVDACSPAELAPRPAVQIFDNAGLASFQTLDIGTNNNVDHEGYGNSTNVGWENGLASSVESGQWWDDTVYLIKTGQGGSNIAAWNVGGTYWTKFLTRTRNALSILQSLGKVPAIYVWYSQGINDANQGVPEATWMADTKLYHARLRAELGFVPIFMTKLIDVGAAFNDSIDQMTTEDSMLYAIDVTGAATGDAHHWNYAGMNLLASRFVAGSQVFGQHEAYMMRQIKMLSGGITFVPSSLPSIIRSPTAISFTEGSSGATFTARLSAAPSASVTVDVTVVGGNAARSPTTLTFTTGNWASDQTVTITSPDDGTASGDRSSTVTLSSAGVSASVTVGVTIVDAGVGGGPVNTVLPAVTGSTGLGAVLTCTSGTWTNSPTGYTYQWRRAGTPISGETATTHTIVALDQGTSLTCVVTATNGSGSSSATSNSVSIPGGGGPFGGTLTPVTWTSFSNTAAGASGELHNTSNSSPGAVSVQTINFAQPWEVEIEYPTDAGTTGIVIEVDDDNTADYGWGNASLLVAIGCHNSGGAGNCFSNINQSAGALELEGAMPTFPGRVKMVKNGNDVDFYKANGAAAYTTPFGTRTGALTSYQTGTGYVKAVFALATTGQSIIVRGLSS